MKFFEYSRPVAFCDTDAMAVVHHANYLRYFEEARVAWMRARDLSDTHFPKADAALAVISSRIFHYRPVGFDDVVTIRLQVKRERMKIYFRYAMHSDKRDAMIASGETVHVAVNKQLRPTRLTEKFIQTLEKEPWIETWPWNS
jgi:acyl-CoA thioester hydrolase